MATSRQLAAIMFADISGYTSLVQEDEERAYKLRQKLLNKLEEEVKSHHGRVIEFRGDGALCSFSSAIEAVTAALAIQTEMQSEPVVPLRIGLHTGDVMLENDSLFGDGVNIASRIESFATPGSIFISGRVYDDIKNHKTIQTVSMGKYKLKNVRETVEIFAISNPGIIIPEKATLEGKGDKAHSRCILVLPFLNLSNDPSQDFFSDGLTEELILKLSHLKEMRIISRTTSMKYKGTTLDTKTIGSETGAGYIMEGSVRKHGNSIRITAQFVDAQNDVHLWAESYTGTLDDIFDIQEKVSNKIMDALRIHLSREEQDTLQKRYTENTEAYQLYLKGLFFWKKRNEQGLNSAVSFFEQAIKKDPDYALAWAGLADTYSLMGEYTNISRRELYPKQMMAVGKALSLDNQLAEAHISLAISHMLNEWEWAGAEKEFKIGLELNPNYATGHHWYAELLLFTGKKDEAFKEINQAVLLDPVSQGILKDKGIFYYYNREYKKAIDTGLRTLELDPTFTPARRLLSLSYAGLGMFDEAIMENNRWEELLNNRAKTEVARAHILAASGKFDEAKKIIEQPQVQNNLSQNDHRGVAIVYATLGEADKTFEWLEKSFDAHEESLCSLAIDPKFDLVRSDKRFDGMLDKLKLSSYINKSQR